MLALLSYKIIPLFIFHLLNEMGGGNLRRNDFAGLLQHTIQGINDNDTALFGVLVKVPVRLVVLVLVPCHLVQQRLGKLPHLRREAAHSDNQPSLFPALAVGQDVRVKQLLA